MPAVRTDLARARRLRASHSRSRHVRSEHVDPSVDRCAPRTWPVQSNGRRTAPAAIEELMYRVARRPESKLIALLPAAEPPPTFHELEQNLSRACLPITLRQNASGSRIRALL